MTTYRFQFDAPSSAALNAYVPGSPTVSARGADVFVDIDVVPASLADLQEYMTSIGWTYIGASPSTTPQQDTATDLPAFGSSTKGVVPASGGGTSNFLRADGTWASPAAGSFAATQTTVDFGTAPLPSKVFDVADAAAVTTNKVVAVVAGTMPTGVDFDELEMDPLTVFAYVPINGTVRFLVTPTSPFSMMVGQRKLNYALG